MGTRRMQAALLGLWIQRPQVSCGHCLLLGGLRGEEQQEQQSLGVGGQRQDTLGIGVLGQVRQAWSKSSRLPTV